MSFERAILHMDLDTFFVSVERLKNRDFVGKPVIIGGGSNRGVVSSCSYEARKFGVHSAMPMMMAKRLCPEAVYIQGDMEMYSDYSHLVTDVIADSAPIYEKASIDEFYLDLTGMDKFFGCYLWSSELRTKILNETGLPISFGLSVNKLVSKVGTGEAKPNGQIEVAAGYERSFLAPLSVAKIPGIGKVTYKKLSFMGVRTINVLRSIPPNLLVREFGKHGQKLWNSANAIDNSPVVPYSERKSLSKERTFSVDTINLVQLKAVLTDMVTKLSFQLRNSSKLTSVVTVKIRYSDFNTYSKQKKIPYTSNDKILFNVVFDLFDALFSRRQLVRLIGVRFGGLVQGGFQIDLFEDTMKEISLLEKMDVIRKKFGKNAIKRASSMYK